VERTELVDILRRAVKLATENSTDLTLAEQHHPAASYTDPERFAQERALVRRAPQLVGYASELPKPGTFVTKDVMGTPVLLTRARDGAVRAFHNICRHRQAPVADGCGAARRLVCPYHSWSYDLDGAVAAVPGQEGFPQAREAGLRLTELPAQEHAGFLWVGLDPGSTLDVAAHLGELGPELASWDLGAWTPVGEKKLDSRIDWKLALDTFAENYHFATVHKNTFATVARSNCTVFDSYGPHHRLVFPMLGVEECAGIPEEQWEPMHRMVVIYALYPNIVLSVTPVNGEVFRVYPGDGPGHSVTYHQNAAPLDLSKEGELEGAQAVFEYAHGTVRDEDYTLATLIQANLETGLQPELLFGRNEPGLQHRHAVLAAALGEA
jgi:phenylpropionate dioxygenase-like ring-hydroxylating dioxygenase large terminal subunit